MATDPIMSLLGILASGSDPPRGGGVSAVHEARHRIMAADPSLFSVAVKRATGLNLPVAEKVERLNVDLTEIRPMERRADTVLIALFAGHPPGILLVESQGRKDDPRRRRWPYYIAYHHDKYSCPVGLLVICSTRAAARFSREPIVIGLEDVPCMIINPIVLGPDNFAPIITTAEAAQNVYLAALGALIHRTSRGHTRDAILDSLAEALTTVEKQVADNLAELIELGLGRTEAGKKWKAMMATGKYEFATEQRRKGRREGRQAGELLGTAKSVLQNLENRKIPVDGTTRDRVLACVNMSTLKAWLKLSLKVSKASDLFAR